MNRALSTKSFWEGYFRLEPEKTWRPTISELLDMLGEDFVVEDGSVDFTFPCSERFELLIEYQPDTAGCTTNLLLIDVAEDQEHRLGWLDLARWHPYCIRPSELDMLLRHWSSNQARQLGEDESLLLLAPFVGVSTEAECEVLTQRVLAAYERLLGCKPAHSELPLGIAEDYAWRQDAALGWVFENEEYACYSIRNPAHASGEEGRFPFSLFTQLMRELNGE